MNDIDDQYRQASAQDPSQPSESTRQNILAHAAKLASERVSGADPVGADLPGPAANQPSWRPSVVGTLMAACLALLLMTPLFMPPRAPSLIDSSAPAAGGAAPDHAPESERARSVPPPTPDTVPAPAAKTVRNVPAAPQEFVPQETLSAGAPTAADSTQRQPGAPRASAPPAPAERPALGAPRNSVAPELFNSPLAGRSNFAAGGAAAPPGSAVAPTSAAALLQAAEAGDLSHLQALLATPIDINARDAHGRTALMLATMGGKVGAVNVLVGYGADANAADADGITPLQAALTGAQPAIAAALRRAGAH
jgi:hypothetical protein